MYPKIDHHGGAQGVTGSCHQLWFDHKHSLLVDCGLFQGQEVDDDLPALERLSIDFPIETIEALVVTHVHIDHIGRLPYLLAAGFRGPIICSPPSAHLLPLVIEDALKIGFTRNKVLIERFLDQVNQQLVVLPYKQWHSLLDQNGLAVKVRLQRAGHILGSAYIEVDYRSAVHGELSQREGNHTSQRIVFSGDLGAPWTPLLPAPRSPYRADILVLESTYGDRLHQHRRERSQQLAQLIEHAMHRKGHIIIPAFSIGRTQELLYELEHLLHQAEPDSVLKELEVIVDSPLAAKFTQSYRELKEWWDKEAWRRYRQGRHPLSFEELYTVDSHDKHLQTVNYLSRSQRSTLVIAASGMASGGRIVNYLKAMLGQSRHQILFTGYQAKGTPGADILRYGPAGGWVTLDGQRYDIRASVQQISGYSAHADQKDLVNFVRRMRDKPQEIRLVHGDNKARVALKGQLERLYSSDAMMDEVQVLLAGQENG